MGSFWTKSYGCWMQPGQPSRTFTWNTSSLPPILNCDSNKMVNFSSVTDSAPRRSDRLILFKDCRDIMPENEQNYTHTINIQWWTHLSLISVTRWEVNNAFGMGGVMMFTTCDSAGWFFKALQGGHAGSCSVWSLQKRLDLSDSFLDSLKRRPISRTSTKVMPWRTARPSERWHTELTSEALTMFLKWALRVPVVWWYSITQLLFRISPLLSLWQRSNNL